jgi:outer membrane receptor protein involved in Fe transport
MYQEVRVPFTSPTWNFPGFYSLEVDFAEREEWYSNNTSGVLPSGLFKGGPSVHTTFNAQKPKVSVRWQPIDPKYIGALTLRGSYTEAFHAPTLPELTLPRKTSQSWRIRSPLRPRHRLRNVF